MPSGSSPARNGWRRETPSNMSPAPDLRRLRAGRSAGARYDTDCRGTPARPPRTRRPVRDSMRDGSSPCACAVSKCKPELPPVYSGSCDSTAVAGLRRGCRRKGSRRRRQRTNPAPDRVELPGSPFAGSRAHGDKIAPFPQRSAVAGASRLSRQGPSRSGR